MKSLKINEIFIKNEKEMINFGKRFSKKLEENSLIFLEGELGAGKTTFVKGIALGLGLGEKMVRSPSFLIIHNYEKIIHIDLYRIQKASYEELEEMGIIEVLNSKNIKIVEWPNDLIKKMYPKAIKFYFKFKGKGRYVRWEN